MELEIDSISGIYYFSLGRFLKTVFLHIQKSVLEGEKGFSLLGNESKRFNTV